ncbi:elongation factor P [Candidatus Amesbacteria bacterium]|nr:elongation factor P [Candidatus Amesbacteria bacterium]
MAMLNVQDLRNGMTFLMDGQLYITLKYEHIKMGRGSATIKIKAKNLLTGATTDKSFVNSAKVEEANTSRRPMQFLYKDGQNFVFMDPKDFGQIEVGSSILEDNAKYLKETVLVNILFWEDRPLWIELPPKMEFTVAETDPGIKGNSAANMYKSAVLDNGMTVRVPLFINEGEKIIIDTRDGNYAERVK